MSTGRSEYRRKEIARNHRRAEVAELYLSGYVQARIADVLAIAQGTVSKDLAFLHKQWAESSLIDLDAKKALELKRIDTVEREAWDAWRRSVGSATVKTIATRGAIIKEGKEGTTEFKELRPAETTLRTEDLPGDPRYLTVVLKCIEQRRRILGLDAPQKIAPTDPTGEHEYTGLTNSERRRRILELLGLGSAAVGGLGFDGTGAA